mmetsp:Transcript_64166/g.199095  ORF Transcript_64166/g.199095 Transcript_64166/m.199095 type:complete len:194 (-) Transcript_64166:482-1063(-)
MAAAVELPGCTPAWPDEASPADAGDDAGARACAGAGDADAEAEALAGESAASPSHSCPSCEYCQALPLQDCQGFCDELRSCEYLQLAPFQQSPITYHLQICVVGSLGTVVGAVAVGGGGAGTTLGGGACSAAAAGAGAAAGSLELTSASIGDGPPEAGPGGRGTPACQSGLSDQFHHSPQSEPPFVVGGPYGE